MYFAFTTNIFNKAKAILFSTSHGVLTFILMLLFPFTLSSVTIYERAGEIKLNGFSSFQSNDIQKLPGPEHPGAAAEIH